MKSQENGLLEKSTKAKPPLERQIRVETSKLKTDQNLLSKVENMSGKLQFFIITLRNLFQKQNFKMNLLK